MSLKLVAKRPAGREDRAAVVDEYACLDWKLRALKPEIAAHKALREKILSWFPGLSPKENKVVKGRKWDVTISPAENRREITDQAKAFHLLKLAVGLKRAIELITIPLTKAVDACIPKARHPEFLKTERTGPREVIGVPKLSKMRPAA